MAQDRKSDLNQLKVALENLLRQTVAPATLVHVIMADETDSDGDPVLRLRVVYDERTGRIDDRNVFDAYGSVQPILKEFGDDRFPLMTFVSREDYEAAA